MTEPILAAELRHDILQKHGLTKRAGRIVPLQPDDKRLPVYIDPRKTAPMLACEYKTGLRLERVLAYDGKTLEEKATLLGVHFTTVSKWRLTLGIRTSGMDSQNHPNYRRRKNRKHLPSWLNV